MIGGMKERMGDYMLWTGAMNQSQVDEVARAKAGGDARHFGEIAVALGYITAPQIDAYLATLK
jgi:hypothetical protein